MFRPPGPMKPSNIPWEPQGEPKAERREKVGGLCCLGICDHQQTQFFHVSFSILSCFSSRRGQNKSDADISMNIV